MKILWRLQPAHWWRPQQHLRSHHDDDEDVPAPVIGLCAISGPVTSRCAEKHQILRFDCRLGRGRRSLFFFYFFKESNSFIHWPFKGFQVEETINREVLYFYNFLFWLLTMTRWWSSAVFHTPTARWSWNLNWISSPHFQMNSVKVDD